MLYKPGHKDRENAGHLARSVPRYRAYGVPHRVSAFRNTVFAIPRARVIRRLTPSIAGTLRRTLRRSARNLICVSLHVPLADHLDWFENYGLDGLATFEVQDKRVNERCGLDRFQSLSIVESR
jgi:hypothetical protein